MSGIVGTVAALKGASLLIQRDQEKKADISARAQARAIAPPNTPEWVKDMWILKGFGNRKFGDPTINQLRSKGTKDAWQKGKKLGYWSESFEVWKTRF